MIITRDIATAPLTCIVRRTPSKWVDDITGTITMGKQVLMRLVPGCCLPGRVLAQPGQGTAVIHSPTDSPVNIGPLFSLGWEASRANRK